MITYRETGQEDGALSELALDLTPILDILFILLVFFMLTAGTVFQSLKVQLPSDVDEALPRLEVRKHILLEITEQGYGLDDRQIADFAVLQATLPAVLRAHPSRDLIIASDRRVDVERLLRLLTFLQSKGIETANVLLNRKKNP